MVAVSAPLFVLALHAASNGRFELGPGPEAMQVYCAPEGLPLTYIIILLMTARPHSDVVVVMAILFHITGFVPFSFLYFLRTILYPNDSGSLLSLVSSSTVHGRGGCQLTVALISEVPAELFGDEKPTPAITEADATT